MYCLPAILWRARAAILLNLKLKLKLNTQHDKTMPSPMKRIRSVTPQHAWSIFHFIKPSSNASHPFSPVYHWRRRSLASPAGPSVQHWRRRSLGRVELAACFEGREEDAAPDADPRHPRFPPAEESLGTLVLHHLRHFGGATLCRHVVALKITGSGSAQVCFLLLAIPFSTSARLAGQESIDFDKRNRYLGHRAPQPSSCRTTLFSCQGHKQALLSQCQSP